MPPVSVVIPVLNEVNEIPSLLESLRHFPAGREMIFVDGGSSDGSAALLKRSGHAVLECGAGRARQMNAGARATSGDVLLFLHADARLPAESFRAMQAAMRDPTIVGGRFDLAYETSEWPYPWLARLGNWRSRLTRIFTGDQTIFIRRAAFETLGGYPEIPLMEDVELSRRLSRLGRVACLRAPVVGSTRKLRREGVYRTILLMLCLRTLHALGVAPERLHRLYYRRDPAKRLVSVR